MAKYSTFESDSLITDYRHDNKKYERSCCIICTAVFASFAIGTAIFLAIMFFS